MKRVLIAFDCDHTLIDETIDTYVLRLLPDGGKLPPHVEKLYSIHHWNDYQREVFRHLHSYNVTKDQLLTCVDEMPMVKGMRELLEYLVTYKMDSAKDKSCVDGVKVAGVVNGDASSKVAENGVSASQQQQTTMNGVETVPLAGSAASVESPHSLLDGKNHSGSPVQCGGKNPSPVQFDIIIISDANSVSTYLSVSLWLVF